MRLAGAAGPAALTLAIRRE